METGPWRDLGARLVGLWASLYRTARAGYFSIFGVTRTLMLFSDNVYGGGALVLFALHEKIGDRQWRGLERA